MASINRFRGSPRATYNGLIRHVTTVTPSASGQDLLTTVGPTVTLQIPNGLLEGDLVVVYCYYRGATQNWSVSNAAGQMWVPCATHRSTTQMVQAFYCRFNGVWPAAPAFTIGSGTETAVVTLHGFRSTRGRDARWALDQSPLLNSGAGTGFTITGVTPQSRDTLAIACVASQDDNEYTLTTPGRWSLFAPFKQYRSTGGTDGSMAFAHCPQTNIEATGNLTFTQETLGADAGITMVLVFKDTDTAYDGKQQISRAPSRKAPGKRMFVAAARSAESPAPAGGTVTGNLAATESADTFAATGNVIVQGTLAATESADTFAATGDVVVQGRSPLRMAPTPSLLPARSPPSAPWRPLSRPTPSRPLEPFSSRNAGRHRRRRHLRGHRNGAGRGRSGRHRGRRHRRVHRRERRHRQPGRHRGGRHLRRDRHRHHQRGAGRQRVA